MHSPEEVVHLFMDAINSHDVDRVAALMTDDHVFVDAAGGTITGSAHLRPAWQGYFAWFPNYEVHADEMYSRGGDVAAFGYAGGTFGAGIGSIMDNTWRLPAAWRARVRDGRVARWQVFCDTEPVWNIMRRAEVHPPQPR